MERLLDRKTRLYLLWLDIRFFVSRVKSAYYETRTHRLNRQIKEMQTIIAIQMMERK